MTQEGISSSRSSSNSTLPALNTDCNADESPSGGRQAENRCIFVPVLRHGAASDKGPRHEMQDCHVGCDSFEAPATTPLNGRDDGNSAHTSNECTELTAAVSHAFYAIFDGHGGVAAATFASSVLLEYICEQQHFLSDPQSAMTAAFLRTDWEYFQRSQRVAEAANVYGVAGTTALAAIVSGNLLVVANAGDSRAVLSRGGKAIELSSDHKPCSSDERTRIRDAGGFVCREDRINGELTVSRAIGDYHLPNLKACKDDVLEGPLTAEPDVRSHELDSNDEFLLMACDGLWDVVSSQRAVSFAASRLRQDNNATQCAQDLHAADRLRTSLQVQYAIDLKSGDNVSVIVVCFREEGLPPRPPPRPTTGRSMLRRGRSLSSDGLSTLSEALRAPPAALGSRLQSETLTGFPPLSTRLSSPTAMSLDSPTTSEHVIARNGFSSNSNRAEVSSPLSDFQPRSDGILAAHSGNTASTLLLDRAPTAVIPELAPLSI